jgi:hypothetical protein
MRITNFIRNLVGQGEVIASWGEAKLVKNLDGKLELRGGSKEDRGEAREWISMFWHEAVVGVTRPLNHPTILVHLAADGRIIARLNVMGGTIAQSPVGRQGTLPGRLPVPCPFGFQNFTLSAFQHH